MLLRFLQKGLTFHNIPLMPGITAQDDENVVYSKQIGAEENNGKARQACVLCSQSPECPQSWSSHGALLEVPASRHLGPGQAWSPRGKRLRQTATTLAWPALGSHSGHCPWALLNAMQTCHAEAPASPCHVAFPILKGKNSNFSNLPKLSGQSQVKN